MNIPADTSKIYGKIVINLQLFRQCFETCGCCDNNTHEVAKKLFANLDELKSHLKAKHYEDTVPPVR